MKKKIGDLTLNELKEIQVKECDKYQCIRCPFNEYCIRSDVDLNKEIEVEEDERL